MRSGAARRSRRSGRRAGRAALVRPVVDGGEYGYQRVNVTDQWDDPGSLLHFVHRLIGARTACSEISSGEMTLLETDAESVFAHRYDRGSGTVVMVHNLAPEPRSVRIAPGEERSPVGLLGTAPVESDGEAWAIDLPGYGYRWLRGDRPGGT